MLAQVGSAVVADFPSMISAAGFFTVPVLFVKPVYYYTLKAEPRCDGQAAWSIHIFLLAPGSLGDLQPQGCLPELMFTH